MAMKQTAQGVEDAAKLKAEAERLVDEFGAAAARLGGDAGLRPPGHAGTGAGAANAATPRAHGGPVTPGQGFIVGEREPEFFAPGVQGRIHNMQQMRDMVQQINSGGGQGATVDQRSYSFNFPSNNPAGLARYTRDHMMMDLRAALLGSESRA